MVKQTNGLIVHLLPSSWLDKRYKRKRLTPTYCISTQTARAAKSIIACKTASSSPTAGEALKSISGNFSHAKHVCEFDINEIQPISSRNNRISEKDLSQLEHLVYGSNSSICSARLNNVGHVIVKVIKKDVHDRKLADTEFESEHRILCRIRYAWI